MFDNSYSYFKSKKLTYSVVMTTPLTELEKSANRIEENIFDQNDNDISQIQMTKSWAENCFRCVLSSLELVILSHNLHNLDNKFYQILRLQNLHKNVF